MKISTIATLLNAQVHSCQDLLDAEVYEACGSDMMSDVLAYVKNQAVLLSGLVNAQVVKTADMMDMRCVVLVRNKVPTPDMIALAEESGIVLLSTSIRMYEACGILYVNGLKASAEA